MGLDFINENEYVTCSLHVNSSLIKFLGYEKEEDFLLETCFSKRCPDFMGDIIDKDFIKWKLDLKI
jgi:hypothetical protein